MLQHSDSSIHQSNKPVLSACYVPDTVLTQRDETWFYFKELTFFQAFRLMCDHKLMQ